MDGAAHPTKIVLRERRERVVTQLTDSFARDELGIEAFEKRIDAAYRCESEADLDALVADLRARDVAEEVAVLARAELAQNERVVDFPARSLAAAPSRPVLRALFSNIERADRLAMPRDARVEAIFGNLELDLRQTDFAPGVTELCVKAIFASVDIVVPADITVEVYGGGVFGNFEGATRATADPDAPVLRIVGSAVFASVVVRTLPPLRVQRLAAQLRARHLLPP